MGAEERAVFQRRVASGAMEVEERCGGRGGTVGGRDGGPDVHLAVWSGDSLSRLQVLRGLQVELKAT